MSLCIFDVRDPFGNKPSSLKGYPVLSPICICIIYTSFNVFIAFYISLTSVNDIIIYIYLYVFVEITE